MSRSFTGRQRSRYLRYTLSAAFTWLLPVASGGQATAAADTTARALGPGVTLRRIRLPEGPVVLHVLTIDLARPELVVRAVRACDRATGRERPSAIAGRLRADGLDVVAVLNAGFFDLRGGTGASETSVVVDGEIAKGVAETESPFDVFDNTHSQFAITAGRRPAIERFRLSGTVQSRRGRWPLGTINGVPVRGEAALYTAWGDPPRFPVDAPSAAVPLVRLAQRGDTVRYRVARAAAARDTVTDTTGTRALLVGVGGIAGGIARLRPGDDVSVVATFEPRVGPLRALVGGWPRLVRGGRSVAEAADSLEGVFPRFSATRNPRSAVGFSRDSTTLFLVAVDGRQAASTGMTLPELARAMIALGAHDALNLDGGGSTALVIGDSVVNSVSDAAGERPVGDVLVVTREPPGRAPLRRRALPAPRPPASCVMPGAQASSGH